MDLLTHRDAHGYNTRHKDMICLPIVKTNWGKQRLSYHAVKDWNNLNDNITVEVQQVQVFLNGECTNFYVTFRF